MRNKRVALTEDQTRAVAWATDALKPFVGSDRPVTVSYSTRDGAPKVLRGKVLGIVGSDSTIAVTVETENGPRSANLYRISGIGN